MPATYMLLVFEARQGVSPVRRVVASPCRSNATRDWLPSGHAGKLISATRGWEVWTATGVWPVARGVIRNGSSASPLSFVWVLSTVTLMRASCSYNLGSQAKSDERPKSRTTWNVPSSSATLNRYRSNGAYFCSSPSSFARVVMPITVPTGWGEGRSAKISTVGAAAQQEVTAVTIQNISDVIRHISAKYVTNVPFARWRFRNRAHVPSRTIRAPLRRQRLFETRDPRERPAPAASAWDMPCETNS